MRISILIPTYNKHIPLNARFLKSVEDNCVDGGVPDIFFATSSKDESRELSLLIDSLPDKLRGKVHCFDVEDEVKEYESALLNTQYDSDATMFFRERKFGIINLKNYQELIAFFHWGSIKLLCLIAKYFYSERQIY